MKRTGGLSGDASEPAEGAAQAGPVDSRLPPPCTPAAPESRVASAAPPATRRGWRDLRNALLADPRFQRWAAAFPFTRPVARRRAAAMFDLVAGFAYSQVLLACVRLDLLEMLAPGPMPLDAVAARIGIAPDRTRCLLEAAAALRLLERRERGRYGLGPQGAALRGVPGALAMIEHHAALYADLADPVALLRRPAGEATSLSRYWAYADAGAPHALPAERVADYSTLMSASQSLIAEQVLDAYPLSRHRCLLDIGGGDGAFLLRAAARAPALRGVLFDLPAVAARAHDRFASAGLASRLTADGGDFLRDPLPAGADVVSLVRVVHDHDDAVVARLLQAVHAALPPGGTLLVAEPMAGTAGAEAMGAAYFGFYLLAMGQGRPRRYDELAALLENAGFRRLRRIPTTMPLQTSLLAATA